MCMARNLRQEKVRIYSYEAFKVFRLHEIEVASRDAEEQTTMSLKGQKKSDMSEACYVV